MNRALKKPLRAVAALGAGIALALATPLAASAHSTIDPDHADPNGWTYLTLRVPTESDTASTTAIDVHLPTDTPFTSVSYEPVDGWTTTVTQGTLPEPVKSHGNTITKAPETISYRADGDGVLPGQTQTFTISVGPVPDTGHVVIPVTQTYSDGTVVEWKATPEEVAADDTLDPAPVLWINDAPPSDDGHSHSDDEAAPAAADDQTANVALGLGIAGLVVGVGGALLAAVALSRSTRGKKESA